MKNTIVNANKKMVSRMIKYCERCGTSLGECTTKKKWCEKCLKIIRIERQRKARKEKGIKPLGVVTCAFCGKPLQKNSAAQKYHKECAREVDRQRALSKYRRGKKKGRIYRKIKIVEPEHKPPRYSIKQINDKAKSLGMDYGHYSTLLSQGKVDPPDER